jgi:hypothetical protein
MKIPITNAFQNPNRISFITIIPFLSSNEAWLASLDGENNIAYLISQLHKNRQEKEKNEIRLCIKA